MHAGKPRFDVLTDPLASTAADSLALLADDTRLKILWVLMQGEANVGTVAELIGAKAPAVSQHLAKLRMAGMVEVRREGTFAFYRASDDHIMRILVDLLDHTGEELAAQAAVAAQMKDVTRAKHGSGNRRRASRETISGREGSGEPGSTHARSAAGSGSSGATIGRPG